MFIHGSVDRPFWKQKIPEDQVISYLGTEGIQETMAGY